MNKASVAIMAFVGSSVMTAPLWAGAPPPTPIATGCIAILSNCNPESVVLETICGEGAHAVENSDGASYVRFGAGVVRVILTQCGTGAERAIDGSTNLCDLPGGADGPGHWNDALCAVELLYSLPPPGSAAPAASAFGLAVLVVLLSLAGAFAVMRRAPR